MKILLSIKPEFANKIFSGNKKFEYRKNIFKRRDIKTVVVYVTKPVGKIIGEFYIDEVVKEIPESLWNLTYKDSGISKVFFDKYFEGRDYAFALKIKSAILYKIPIDPYSKCRNFVPPQSFKYIDNEMYSNQIL